MSSLPAACIAQRFSADAARFIQEAIADAGGHEVFFAGALDSAGRVAEVRVCARGNANAVPALFEGLDARDVVIHNHPSGGLTPSNADLELASMYGAHGHGMYIVDNEVLDVYVVVEPFLPKDTQKLDAAALARYFSPGGRMAAILPRFEARPQQTRMMEAVARAFNQDGIAVVEAPTGVGKTIAYLLPSIEWALSNKERVVISTRTINLQEQIVFKDIPLLRRVLDMNFQACLVKGRGNYICWTKLNRAFSEATLFDDEDLKTGLHTLGEWVEKTKDGSKSDLPFVPARELWEKVCSESDTCSMSRCPDQKRCFVGQARREVAKADIIVVNHHMLFSDVAVKKEAGDHTAMAVLPSFKRLILDEAHSIEDSATEYLGASVTRAQTLATLNRFQRTEMGRERGLLPMIRAKLVKDCPQLSVAEFEAIQVLLDNQLLPALAACREALLVAFDTVRTLTAGSCGQIGRDVKWRLTPDVLQLPEVRRVHASFMLPAVEACRQFVLFCFNLHRRLEEIAPNPASGESPVAVEAVQLRAFARRIEQAANVLAENLSEELAPNTVRWVEIDAKNEHLLRLVRCPLEVGPPLAEWVYDKLDTVVMTSATLAVEGEFRYLFQRLGLDRVESRRAETVVLDSPFDFEHQALLGVMTDLPDPGERAFLDASVESIRRALRITRGHAFVLFTSFYAMDYTFNRLAEELRRQGIEPLKQGQTNRTQLLDTFRRDTSSVLFATDSFWEGVDVVGESLQCVILPKLPFRVPTEPVLEARAEAIAASGGNAFLEYSVPQAVIKFRQGFGRLIRSRTDRGVVLLLDRRVVSKFYGRVFLRSLPGVRLMRGPGEEVYSALEAFFNPEATRED